MTQKKGGMRQLSSKDYLECVRKMPDSNKKLYKLMAMTGNSQLMQAVSREYARLAAKGYRPERKK